jgi:hypothetical protein
VEQARKTEIRRKSIFESDLFHGRMEKSNLNSCEDFGTTCKIRLKTRLEYGRNRFLKNENIELLCYIICT